VGGAARLLSAFLPLRLLAPMFRLFKGSKPGAAVSLGPAAPYYDANTPSPKEQVPASVVESKPAALHSESDALTVETKHPLVTRGSELSVASETFMTPTAEFPEPLLEKVQAKQDDAPGILNEPVVAATPAAVVTSTLEDDTAAELKYAAATGAGAADPGQGNLPVQPSHVPTANEIIASTTSASEPASPKPRRRSLPGFGFWGNKKHAEAVAHEGVSPPTPTAALTPVIETPPATAAQLADADHLVVPASSPPRRKKSLKKPRPKADAAKHQDAVSPDTAVVPVATAAADSPTDDTTGTHASPVDDAQAHADVVVAPAAVPPPPQQGSGPLKKERHVMVKKSERKADEAAIGVRTLIIGPDPEQPKSKPLTKSEVNKLKGQLLEPKSAGKIIQRLRNLPVPAPPRPSVITHDTLQHSVAPEADVARAAMASHAHPTATKQGPIHAVCLDCTDREADELHFSQLGASMFVNPSFAVADAATAFPVLRNMRIISLLKAPDFGLGAPIGSANAGILSGSIPSPAVIADGILQLSQQLVALGFATGATVHTNHSGIYPPLDRISVLTCEQFWRQLVRLETADTCTQIGGVWRC